jgi:hypothetical protein
MWRLPLQAAVMEGKTERVERWRDGERERERKRDISLRKQVVLPAT